MRLSHRAAIALPDARVLACPDQPSVFPLNVHIGEAQTHIELLTLIIVTGDVIDSSDDTHVPLKSHLKV